MEKEQLVAVLTCLKTGTMLFDVFWLISSFALKAFVSIGCLYGISVQHEFSASVLLQSFSTQRAAAAQVEQDPQVHPAPGKVEGNRGTVGKAPAKKHGFVRSHGGI